MIASAMAFVGLKSAEGGVISYVLSSLLTLTSVYYFPSSMSFISSLTCSLKNWKILRLTLCSQNLSRCSLSVEKLIMTESTFSETFVFVKSLRTSLCKSVSKKRDLVSKEPESDRIILRASPAAWA